MKTKILYQILCAALAVGLSTTAGAQTTNAYSDAVLADQPVVFYQFDESTGATVAVDSSGNGNNGYYSNVSLGNAGAAAGLGYAAGFNGSNSFVAVPALGSAISLGGNGNDQFTIECWINPQSVAGGAIYTYDGWDTGALNYLWDWNGPGVQFALNGMDVIGGGTTVFDSAPPIPTNQWTYVATVYATSNVVVYVNGQVVGTNFFGGVAPVDFEPAEIGAQTSAGGRYFNGQMDEFAIYTNALSVDRIQAHYLAAVGPFIVITIQPQGADVASGQTVTFTTSATVVGTNEVLQYQWRANGVDIAGATNATYTTPILTVADNGVSYDCVVAGPEIYPATTSNAVLTVIPYASYSDAVLADHPVVYYRFEESTGAMMAMDSSGNSNNGLYNNTSLGNASASSALGYAAGFDGSNSFVTVPALGNAYSLGGDGNDQFTIECWIKPQTIVGAAIYANPWATGALNYLWDWTGPGIQFSLNGNATTGTTVFDSDPPIPTGQWTYVAAVYNNDDTASNVIVYVNGHPIGTNVFTSAVSVSFDAGQIGAQTSAGGRYFNGLMDEFTIYTNALSAADIKTHYEAALIQAQPPTLSIANSGNGTAVLSWNASAFILQKTTDLNKGTSWSDILGGTNSPVNVPIGNSSMFYRLRSQ